MVTYAAASADARAIQEVHCSLELPAEAEELAYTTYGFWAVFYSQRGFRTHEVLEWKPDGSMTRSHTNNKVFRDI